MSNESQVPDIAGEQLQEEILTTTLTTYNGQRLSPKEDKFISMFIKYGDATKAAEEAGYTIRAERKNKELQYAKKGKELLLKDYIKDEIAHRSELIRSRDIADATEVMIYLSKVMRGEIKDQFGLDAPLSERTAAAKELNRRFGELEKATDGASGKEVHLVLRRE